MAQTTVLSDPQQILRVAQNVLFQGRRSNPDRQVLIQTAIHRGNRTMEQARKASTMRLAQWARNQKSGI